MNLSELRSLFKRLFDAGLFHLIVSLVCVQGLAYMSQFLVAMLVGPAEFGIVRTIEASLGILIILGSAGMPTLAIKTIAVVPDPTLRGPLLKRMVSIALTCSLAVAGVALLLGRYCLAPGVNLYWIVMVWIIGLTATSRTILSYFQGIRDFKKLSLTNIAFAAVCLGILLVCVMMNGTKGWAMGRYAGEIIFVIGSVVLTSKALRHSGTLPPQYSHVRLIKEGFSVSGSLMLRLMLDNLGLFALGFYCYPTSVLGFYGLGSLVITGTLVLPGAASSLLFPRLVVETSQSVESGWKFNSRTLYWLYCMAAVILVILVLSSPLLTSIFGVKYAPAVTFLNILAVSLPFRMQTSQGGMFLLACNRVHWALWINSLLLAVAIPLVAFAAGRCSATGVAWATVAVEGGSMAAYWLATRKLRTALL